MATIHFNRERFLQSIREYRQHKREWQERINKQLDEKEEEIRYTNRFTDGRVY